MRHSAVPRLCRGFAAPLRERSLGLRAPPAQQRETVADSSPADIDDYDGGEEVYAQVLQEVADRFVHELRKPVGRARLYAETEIVDYEDSRTYKELSRLQEFLDGIQELANAAETAALTEIDLRSLIDEEAAAVGETEGMPGIKLEGPEHLDVIADPALIRLAVSNAIQNAVEAVMLVGSDEPVIVSWGTTDREYYLAILDRGPGVPPVAEALFEIGASSKRGHLGLGLAIARQASRSLGGEIVLSNLEDGLTRFEMRWPKHEVIA